MPKQIILIMGAIIILTRLSLQMNQSVSGSIDSSRENEAILTATEQAQSVLREVAAEKFDERAIDSTVTDPNQMTSVLALGAEFGEAYPAFDDVDDFNGLVRTETASERLGGFTHRVAVWYTTPALNGGVSAIPTFYKAVQVQVYGNSSLLNVATGRPDTVVLHTVVSY